MSYALWLCYVVLAVVVVVNDNKYDITWTTFGRWRNHLMVTSVNPQHLGGDASYGQLACSELSERDVEGVSSDVAARRTPSTERSSD